LSSGAFSARRRLCRPGASDTSWSAPGLNTASCIPSGRLISVCRGHVNDGGFPGSRCLPS
jgi:hypothetical protein